MDVARLHRAMRAWMAPTVCCMAVALAGCGGGDDAETAPADGGIEVGDSSIPEPQGADIRVQVHPDGWDVDRWEPVADGERVAWRWLDETTTGLQLRVIWGAPDASSGTHRVTIRLGAPATGQPAFEAAAAEFDADAVFAAHGAGQASAQLDVPLGPVPPAGARLVLIATIDDGLASAPIELAVEDAYARDPCAPFAPTLGAVGGCVEAAIPMPGQARDVVPSGERRACGELGTVVAWLETEDEAASRCLRSRGEVEWANGVEVETEAAGQCLANEGWGRLGDAPDIETALHLPVDGRDCPAPRFVLTSDVGRCACGE